jgi:hypothetical protein
MCCTSSAKSTLVDATTAAVGSPRATSSANVGPDKVANASIFSRSTEDVTLDIRSSVSISMPFVPEMTLTGRVR